MAFLPAFLTLASLEGMCGPTGTWPGAAWVRGGRQLAWAPRRGGWERGEGAARGWERSWSGNGSKQSHLPPGRWNF